jgi:hypothetical protein
VNRHRRQLIDPANGTALTFTRRVARAAQGNSAISKRRSIVDLPVEALPSRKQPRRTFAVSHVDAGKLIHTPVQAAPRCKVTIGSVAGYQSSRLARSSATASGTSNAASLRSGV